MIPTSKRGVQLCASFSVTVAFLVNAAVAVAQAETVYLVEEDWELIIGEPDAVSDGPQIVCAISPTSDTNSLHATFEVNHQSLPDFHPGGMQMQIWECEDPHCSRKFPDGRQMNTAGETVRWTVRMAVVNGYLGWEITNGQSTTWGEFGGQGYLRAAVCSPVPNLNSYHPEVSVENSGVCYASNRVRYLALKQVRLHLTSGEILVDNTVRVAHELH